MLHTSKILSPIEEFRADLACSTALASFHLVQSAFAHPFGEVVGGDEEDEADHGFKHSGCGRQAKVIHLHAVFQDEYIQIFREFNINAVAKQVLRFEPGLQNMTQIHNQQNDYDWLHAWKRNMPHPLNA